MNCALLVRTMSTPTPDNELRFDPLLPGRTPDSFTPAAGASLDAVIPGGDPLIGTTIVDRYSIASIIGFGGWSVVYRAFDNALNRSVAIKAMHAHLCVDQSKLLRFQREAHASAGLSHQNIAVVYDCGLMWAGRPYIGMELVEGQSLAELVSAGKLEDLEKCVGIFRQICDGLEAVHKMNLVHRDLKPSNIKISDAGVVKVLDFGCAKWILQEQNLLTKSDESVGTPAYMSPEQCLGKTVDARSDIYSFGCVMYEVLTGTRPFASDNLLDCMHMHLKMMPQKFSVAKPGNSIPEGLEVVVFKALAKDPEDRYQSVRELNTALASSLSSLSFASKLLQPWHRLGARRRRRVTAIGAVTVLAIVIASAAVWQSLKSRSITFPDSHEVGAIYLIQRDAAGQDVGRNKLGGAQGVIRVPLDSYVQLAEVPESDASALTFLQKLRPTDIQRIDLSGAILSKSAVNNINHIEKLDSLSFNNTTLFDESLEKLRLPELVGLNLAGTTVSDSSLLTVSINCLKLHWVQLRGNNHITDAGVGYLARLPRITALMFPDVPNITDACLTQLSRCRTLTNLVLRSDNITDVGLKYLAASRTLRRVDLSSTHITDGGILSVSKMVELTHLNISENKLTDASVSYLCSMKNLKSLNISSTGITAQGIRALKTALRSCEIKSNE